MKVYIIAFLFSLLCPVSFWLCGYNFDSRGFEAIACFAGTIYLYGMFLISFRN